MIYGAILASGVGSRIKSIDIPKQYYEINSKPIIVYTLENILKDNLFDVIYIAISSEYFQIVSNYLNKFIEKDKLRYIKIIFGGKTRMDTIHNVINEIRKNEINDEDIIVIHDAVRPFVTKKILEDNIENAKIHCAVVTAVPVADTMLVSDNGDFVDKIPPRKTLYKGQSPDSFNIKKLIELESRLTSEQINEITGTSQICTMNNYPIKMILGDDINFKITTDSDLKIAKNLILARRKK